MDLISREEVRQARPEWRNEEVKYETEEATVKAREFSRGWNDCLHEYLKDINALPSAFEGMTNKEIISEFVERDDSFAIMVDEVNGTVNIELSLEFWDSPYKGVSE